MEIRDPIHGMIEFNKEEEKIINSEPFQRLRNIKQLALAQYLYPGAHHTRFEHSIGVMEIASRMYDKLKERSEKDGNGIEEFGYAKSTIRKAALLHDIGHGPFSHVSENILQIINGKDKLKLYAEKGLDEFHEFIGIRIIQSSLKGILQEDELNQIVAIIEKPKTPNCLAEIVSGPLDADKFDYLLRDSYFAGVKYGIFDLDRILNVLRIIKDSRESRLGIHEEGVHSIEQFVMSKYFITSQVYTHINRLITDQMLIRCVYLAYTENDGLKEIKKLYEFDDNNEYFLNYCQFDDNSLLDYIARESRGVAGDYAKMLQQRCLFKYSIPIDISDEVNKDVYSRRAIENALKSVDKRLETEKEIAKILKVQKEKIIILHHNLKNPLIKLFSATKELSDKIIIIDEDGNRKTIGKGSILKTNMNEELFNNIYILAPKEKSKFEVDQNEVIKILKKVGE